ncbi:MAG: hypothetical protein AVDCRST_MAG58-3553 [uncultured Rubrobacteraceae bacterium]|uniref:Uncharacterized protein n=1 Tax=uncultured Rubrobacteraceae bacterium TaxID=349277 RepID=A0A6J4R9A4_9ACTN|nr:MAG: hypothetical protein AVDCRST_MAG58-3553 [uncultured Rubrobacteraceae bacterium]
MQDLSPVAVMGDVGYRPAAVDKVGTGRVRAVHELVGVRRARRPAGCAAETFAKKLLKSAGWQPMLR